MAVNNPYAVYQKNKIETASPAELTLMLYDGAIKFCNIALMGMEEHDIEKTSNNILKAENIIAELRGTLNFKYPVAKDFEVVYEYIYDQLTQANIKKEKEPLEEALNRIREMRDTWKEVMRLARQGK